MECDPMLLQAYLDQELEPEVEAAVQHHLAICPTCRRELAALKLLWMELDRVADVEPAPKLVYQRRQVLAAVKAHREQVRRDAAGAGPHGESESAPRSSPLPAHQAALLWLKAQPAIMRPVWTGMQYIPGAHLLTRPPASSGRASHSPKTGRRRKGRLGRLLGLIPRPR
ncbi:anti-sigma factor family protein [Kyrpidia spormannii]|uniref:Uncharacterized protein n=2 Tax=Kyrpidia spormannii TaxID=2055160 RepID=A0ACA8Z5E1_9BACL|nr:anti-sigma factor [Kyrpidia spormannii]CAB3389785.1 conserved protein of unknown function [Kyrpidia spormannii]CAB3390679.1 conserved protein of unknown function [Kyrpidia spormannii]